MAARRVLGVDPGSVVTGWGVVELEGNALRAVEAGVIKVPEKAPLEERLARVHRALTQLVTELAPREVAVEEVFHGRYAQAALRLGHVRGVVLLAVAQASLPLSSYAPALIKRTVAGQGGADKAQVARVVCTILGLSAIPHLDATDALAVAITHLQATRVPGLRPRR